MTNRQPVSKTSVLLCSSFALLAFAANSVLARLALGGHAIDPAGYTVVRLLSGAAILITLTTFRRDRIQHGPSKGTWISALLLFLYAVCFSFAYVSLPTGTGALILFGSVQATMMLVSVAAGERPHAGEWTGLIVALGGLAYLVSPGLEAPEPAGAVLMAAAGTSWGWYTIRGGGVTDALGVTAGNFARTMPLLVALCLFYINTLWFSVSGIVLASGSGMIASGLGYVIWYAALRGLTATRASIIQLAVPAIAALGGVLFLSEEMTMRLMLSAVLILGGIGLALFSRSR